MVSSWNLRIFKMIIFLKFNTEVGACQVYMKVSYSDADDKKHARIVLK